MKSSSPTEEILMTFEEIRQLQEELKAAYFRLDNGSVQRNFIEKRTNGLKEFSRIPEIVGARRLVPLLDQRLVPQIFLDNAASTKSFQDVSDFIQQILPYYSNIHRGTGFDSMFCTERYEEARHIVGDFVGWDIEGDTVIPVRNTTEGMNLLANTIPFAPGDRVLVTLLEHHSNDLPWRSKVDVEHLSINREGEIDLQELASRLQEANGKIRVVSVSGGSNVTGTVTPIHDIAEIAHQYGALIVVDGAQLVPHRRVEMQPHSDPRHIDFLVFSGHKMYCPWGVGALVGRRDLFEQVNPYQPGGGTVQLVTVDRVIWAEAPSRNEAGTPNILGLLALARTIQVLETIGMETIAEHEKQLTKLLLRGFTSIPQVTILGAHDPENVSNRLGVVSFQIQGVHPALVAAILSYEWGIAVRQGCFCAHPLINNLLKVTKEQEQEYIAEILQGYHHTIPGAVRASLGLHNTPEEVQTLIEAVEQIARGQWKGTYEQDITTGEFYPKGFRFDFKALPGFSTVDRQETFPQGSQGKTTVPHTLPDESLHEPVNGTLESLDETRDGTVEQKQSVSPKISRKGWGLLLLSALLLAGGAWGIMQLTRSTHSPETTFAPATTVETLTIRSQPIAKTLELSGTIRPVEQATISTRITGRITYLPWKTGDRFHKGDILARIEAQEIAAQVNQAKANLEQAQARLKELKVGSRPEEIAGAKARVAQAEASLALARAGSRPEEIAQARARVDAARAQAELTNERVIRYQKLKQDGAIPQDRLDQVLAEDRSAKASLQEAERRLAQFQNGTRSEEIERAEAAVRESRQALTQLQNGTRTEQIAQAEAQVAQAQAQLRAAEVHQEDTRVTAPFSGIVTEKLADVGDTTNPYSMNGTALLKIENPDQLQLESSVPTENLRFVHVGQSVQVQVDAIAQTFKAKIGQIVPAADPNSRSFLVKIPLDNSGKLISGMFGRIALPSGGRQETVLIPMNALIQRGELQGVYVVTPSTPHPIAVLRWVKTGKQYNGQVEIISGLMTGDRIVTTNINQLRDGQPINPQP